MACVHQNSEHSFKGSNTLRPENQVRKKKKKKKMPSLTRHRRADDETVVFDYCSFLSRNNI